MRAMNDRPICATCAVQYPQEPPTVCVICADERQYVPAGGQRWTSLRELGEQGLRLETRGLEKHLLGIGVAPPFGIGQRALLISTARGNVLWDTTGYIDRSSVAAIHERGGVDAIAVSHPHFYGVMVEWSRAFDAPLWLPEADRAWVVRGDAEIRWWSDEARPVPGVRLIQCGGHFAGSAVLHWAEGAGGDGALLVGDTATVCPDRQHLAFMRSYPNHIPLPREDVERIGARLTRYPFARVYGAWWDRVIDGGHEAVARSVARHLRWIGAGS
jgi:hypothetical protein